MRIKPKVDQAVAGPVKKARTWLVDKCTPQPDTAGNYVNPPYVPAVLEGAVEGFALRGIPGGITSMTCAAISVLTQDKTKSNLVAVIISTGTGAALAAFTWPAASPTAQIHNSIAGGLLGAFQTYRADKVADVRGAGSFGTLVAGPLLAGSTKVAAGIGAASGVHFFAHKPAVKVLLAAAVGGAVGVGLSLIGFAPLGLAATAVVSAVGAGVGSIIGPHYSQFFRNMSKDIGTQAESGLRKLGLIKKPLNRRLRNSIGAFPSGGLEEGVNGLVYADGNILGLIAGVGMEIVHQVSVFAFSHMPEEHVDDPHAVKVVKEFIEEQRQAEKIAAKMPVQPVLEDEAEGALPSGHPGTHH